MKNKKLKVIIDSDVANEIDDQFAIAYALSCREKLDVLGITIEPFRVSWQKNLSVKDSVIDSKNEANRLLRLMGIKNTNENPFVFKGCEGFISEGYNENNDAVKKIISSAKRYKNLYICCLGTLTNIAMALKISPEIAENINIIWLGTGNILLDKFNDSNFIKDEDAFNIVIQSKVNFTVFPSYMARVFVTSIYEFSNNTKSNNVVKYLQNLMNRFIHTEENLGKKEIYDIGPIAYLLLQDKFTTKEIDAKYLIKDKKIKLPKDRKVNYIIDIPKHFEVWKHFLEAVSSNKNYYTKPQIFFISDTHFGHENKIRTKQVPFKTVEEMNREIIRRWNNTVSTNDIVYHIGDFGDYEIIKKLNGKVTLICGNYEKRDFKENFQEFRKKLISLGFHEVIENGIYLDEKVLGQKVYLTHKPTNHAKDCLTIHGHVHTLKLLSRFGFNVALTYHYFSPINQTTVTKYLDFISKYSDEDVFA